MVLISSWKRRFRWKIEKSFKFFSVNQIYIVNYQLKNKHCWCANVLQNILFFLYYFSFLFCLFPFIYPLKLCWSRQFWFLYFHTPMAGYILSNEPTQSRYYKYDILCAHFWNNDFEINFQFINHYELQRRYNGDKLFIISKVQHDCRARQLDNSWTVVSTIIFIMK